MNDQLDQTILEMVRTHLRSFPEIVSWIKIISFIASECYSDI